MNILRGGFREASYISSQMTISWDEASLLNLVIRRAIHNKALREFYAVEVQEVLADRGRQVELFYRIFPRRVPSKDQARSFEWILQNTCDGSRRNSPRELIHLLSVAQRLQLRRTEIGLAPPDGESLFESPSLQRALAEVSRVRFEQTLRAEYPQLRESMQPLENKKAFRPQVPWPPSGG
jgi:hypothetical protein